MNIKKPFQTFQEREVQPGPPLNTTIFSKTGPLSTNNNLLSFRKYVTIQPKYPSTPLKIIIYSQFLY